MLTVGTGHPTAPIVRAGGNRPRPQGVVAKPSLTPAHAEAMKLKAPHPTTHKVPGSLAQVFKLAPGAAAFALPGIMVTLNAHGGELYMGSSGGSYEQMPANKSGTGMEGLMMLNLVPESPTQNYAFSCDVTPNRKYRVLVDAYYAKPLGDTDTILTDTITHAPTGTIDVIYEATSPPTFVTLFVSADTDWELAGCEGYRMP